MSGQAAPPAPWRSGSGEVWRTGTAEDRRRPCCIYPLRRPPRSTRLSCSGSSATKPRYIRRFIMPSPMNTLRMTERDMKDCYENEGNKSNRCWRNSRKREKREKE